MNTKDASDFDSESAESDFDCRRLNASQQAGAQKICKLYQIRKVYKIEGIRPRLWPLIVGRTGTGKSATVASACDSLKIPLLGINTASWIILGASTKPATLTQIGDFVRKHREGWVFLDEIDKISTVEKRSYDTHWMQGVLSEVLAFLDLDSRLLSFGWRPQDIAKFQSNFFVRAAGSREYLFPDGRDTPTNYLSTIRQQNLVPREIAQRFFGEWIVVEPPNLGDFQKSIIHLRRHLELERLSQSDLHALVTEAIATQRGMRWVEDYLTQLLIESPHLNYNCQNESTQTSIPEKSDKVVFSPELMQFYVNQFFAELRKVRAIVTTLQIQLLTIQKQKISLEFSNQLFQTPGGSTDIPNLKLVPSPTFEHRLVLIGRMANYEFIPTHSGRSQVGHRIEGSSEVITSIKLSFRRMLYS